MLSPTNQLANWGVKDRWKKNNGRKESVIKTFNVMEGSVTSNQRNKYQPMEAKKEYPQGQFQTINNSKYSTRD